MYNIYKMSSDNIKVELYYAEWCGHCKSFKPEWNKLKDELTKNNMKWVEYESEKDSQKIEDENIKGFPTIIIITNGIKNEYEGQRTADDIMNFIKGRGGNSTDNKFKQCGGAKPKKTPIRNNKKTDEYYRIKYLKYKAKYMKKCAEIH